MDEIDRKIVRALQDDGRMTNQALAETVNLSASPCFRRVRSLEEAGVIRGYTAIIDQKAYGLPVTVFLRIRLDQHTRESVSAFEERVGQIEEILDCYLMAGGSDYLVRVLVADLEAYERFVRGRIHSIPHIASIDTSFAFGVVKQARAYPRPG